MRFEVGGDEAEIIGVGQGNKVIFFFVFLEMFWVISFQVEVIAKGFFEG